MIEPPLVRNRWRRPVPARRPSAGWGHPHTRVRGPARGLLGGKTAPADYFGQSNSNRSKRRGISLLRLGEKLPLSRCRRFLGRRLDLRRDLVLRLALATRG